MAINLISPGIQITEADQPPIGSVLSGLTTAGVVGRFRWGPISVPTLVRGESELISNFGEPNSTNAVDFLGAVNFLSYSPSLYVTRVAQTGQLNAVANTSATGVLITNDDAWESEYSNGATTTYGPWTAKYAGTLGNSIKVSTCPNAASWQSTLTGTWDVDAGGTSLTANAYASGSADTEVQAGDLLVIGTRTLKVASVTDANTIVLESAHITGSANVEVTRRWEYFNSFDSAPGTTSYATARGGANDEIHIAIVDAGGEITGTAGTLLEKFQEVSKYSDAKSDTGASLFYADVIKNQSRYIRYMSKDENANAGWDAVTSTTACTEDTALPFTYRLGLGAEGNAPTDSQKIAGYGLFANKANITLDLIPMGDASATVINTVINDVAEQRKDVLILASPLRANVVNNPGDEVSSISTFASTVTKSSYVVLDSNWKYQYDKFNDNFVFVPCNYDVAGIMARTDLNREPWTSPAGYNNGVLLNVTKLAWNPNEAARDSLYKDSINPIFTQTGRGTVLFGDKTFIGKNTSFNRINVRRLFIELQNTIGEFAGNILFDENSQATRTSFVNTVEPYLRSVQARRGIQEFRVVCDDTNNPESVVSANEFVCDIFVRPVSSVNFIQLNFVSVRGSLSFAEITG